MTAAPARFASQVWNTGNGLPQETVRQFLQTTDGFLWMATDGGLVRFDGFEFTVYNRRDTPRMHSDLVNALLQDTQGNLWIGTSDGLLKLSKGQFTRYGTKDGLPADFIVALRLNRGGNQVCATTSSGEACGLAHFAPVPSTPAPLPSPRIPSARAQDGSVWTIGSAGLLRSRNGQSTVVPMPEGFTGSDVLSLYFDREGDLWVGSENAGAAVLRTPPFNILDKRIGLPSDQVRCLLSDSSKNIWIGTSAGLVRFQQGHPTKFTVKQALASNEILALAGHRADDFWVGTPDGLSHMDHGRITTLTASDGLPDDNIRSLLLAQDDSLWLGTTHGLAHIAAGTARAHADRIRVFTQKDGLADNVIGSLLEDRSGSLWIGTRKGLSHVAVNGKVTSYLAPSGASVTALGTDAHGTLWVGTGGAGLYALVGDKLIPATDAGGNAMPLSIYSILDDAHDRLWVGSSDGIYQFMAMDPPAPSTPSLQMSVVEHYGIADGLRIEDCFSGGHPEAMKADGKLYFATEKGVAVIDPRSAALQHAPPPVALESVFIDDISQPIGADLDIPPGRERISFHYAGLEYDTPSKVRYRYRLEPFDPTWIDAGSRRIAYYTNVPPGRYRFVVMASLNGDTWSASSADLILTVEPHYFQTWWFYTLLTGATALLIWQAYLYRLRQVELRYNAVLSERGRIAREIHDTLAQDIVAISVQLDLVLRLMDLSVEKAREQLTQTRELVKKGLANARTSIWDLRSQSPADASTNTDLPSRLRQVLRDLVAGAPLTLNLQITGSYRPATTDLEGELLRIAQEAVTNALRHAEAQTIEVTLTYDAQGVSLRVRDDGRGFVLNGSRSGPPGHYGLKGMYERAQRVRAQLTIESAPGTGTSVFAKARIR